MTRNTTRRVEVAAPILDQDIKKRVLDYFDIQMHDNVKARIMQPDGTYVRAVDSSAHCCAQEKFIAMAYESAPALAQAPVTHTVQPNAASLGQPVQEPRKKGLWAKIKSLFSRK